MRHLARSGLDVFAHNVETVDSLQRRVRDPRAGYVQSLEVLKAAKECGVYTKSSLMLGLGELWGWGGRGGAFPVPGALQRRACRLRERASMPPARAHAEGGVPACLPACPLCRHPTPAGETDEEIIDTMYDLKHVGVDILTFGQYLQPTPQHLDVAEMVPPAKFDHWCVCVLLAGGLRLLAGGPWEGAAPPAKRDVDPCAAPPRARPPPCARQAQIWRGDGGLPLRRVGPAGALLLPRWRVLH